MSIAEEKGRASDKTFSRRNREAHRQLVAERDDLKAKLKAAESNIELLVEGLEKIKDKQHPSFNSSEADIANEYLTTYTTRRTNE